MPETLEDYEVELPFEEVGLTRGSHAVGFFSGTAHIDQDGNVVGLVLDTYDNNPEVREIKGTIYLPVPPASFSLYRSRLDPFWLAIADNIASCIETNCQPEIEELLNDWRAQRSEPDPDDEYDRRRCEPRYYGSD
jgi:hypothetical protein